MRFANPREEDENVTEPEQLDEQIELVEYNDEGLGAGAIIGIVFACLIGLYVVYRLYSWWTRKPLTPEDIARQKARQTIKDTLKKKPSEFMEMSAEQYYDWYANRLNVDRETYTNILKEIMGNEYVEATKRANELASQIKQRKMQQQAALEKKLIDDYSTHYHPNQYYGRDY